MIDVEKTAALKQVLANARAVLVVVTAEASLDQMAAASAVAAALAESGHDVTFLTPSTSVADKYDLELLDTLSSQIGNRDLTVSFPYQPEAVEKVSYHIDETAQRFCLVIKPQKNHKPLSPEAVAFDYAGVEADLIFLVGVHNLETLEQLYYGYEQLYQNTTTVTLHTFEPNIGTIKLDVSGASCMSEATVGFLKNLQLSVPTGAASNLLQAIEETTDSFKSFAATAETFDAVAALLRWGARRRKKSTVSSASPLVMPAVTGPDNHQVLKTGQLVKPETSKKSSMRNGKSKTGSLQYQPTETAVSRG